jgi:hypothetical protein
MQDGSASFITIFVPVVLVQRATGRLHNTVGLADLAAQRHGDMMSVGADILCRSQRHWQAAVGGSVMGLEVSYHQAGRALVGESHGRVA